MLDGFATLTLTSVVLGSKGVSLRFCAGQMRLSSDSHPKGAIVRLASSSEAPTPAPPGVHRREERGGLGAPPSVESLPITIGCTRRVRPPKRGSFDHSAANRLRAEQAASMTMAEYERLLSPAADSQEQSSPGRNTASALLV